MKQEELMKTLIKELFGMDTLHLEYQDNDTHFVIDTQKNGNKLTITVTLKENEDKKHFEEWLQNVDDSLFEEVLEELGEAFDMDRMYNSPRYKEVINKVTAKTKEIAARKIKELQALL